jgi:DNA-directed RNA polymerase beta' subunit
MKPKGNVWWSSVVTKTGYMQKKLQACMSDQRVAQDGTIRNEKNEIITFMYGGHGFDPSRQMKIGDNYYFVDVQQLKREVNSYFDSRIKFAKEYYTKL